MPKGYLIAHVAVDDPNLYAEAFQKEIPVLERHGGRFVARGGRSEVREGELGDLHVVVEFPSYAAARAAQDDPDYQALAEIRRRAARSIVLIVEGAQ